jgi:glycosyltransferase involved in cell wall biosynthesis
MHMAGTTPIQSVASDRRQVLMLRCCRPAQFADAVRRVREEHPNAEISALSHAGHDESLRAAGVDRVVTLPGSRFRVWRLAPWTLRRLRAVHYDDLVIPQMGPWPTDHVNVYCLALALRWRSVTIVPGDEPSVRFASATHFLPYVVQAMGGLPPLLDAVVFLALLAAACVVRRPRVRPVHGRRPRVLHIISSLGVGGAQVQLASLINRTPPEAYDLELLVLGRSDGDFSRQWLDRYDVPVTFLAQWPRLTLSVFEIRKRCLANDYDLVHTWLFMANIVGAAGARLAGAPLVLASVRNLSVWKSQRWYRKWWHRPADVLGSHAADRITVNAQALIRDHARWALVPRSRISVVHNGLDPAHFTASRRDARERLLALCGLPNTTRILGTVGRLAHEKDQVTFVRMLAHVRQTRDDVVGMVVGGGDRRAPLEALGEELGLSDHLFFLGERSDARQLMAGFDLFALTSRSEGFPNVLLEATLLGVPCVATDLAGNPDVLDAPAALFPAGDFEAGARCVVAALATPDATAARARATRERALRLFTAERSVTTWLDLYDRLLNADVVVPAGAALEVSR